MLLQFSEPVVRAERDAGSTSVLLLGPCLHPLSLGLCLHPSHTHTRMWWLSFLAQNRRLASVQWRAWPPELWAPEQHPARLHTPLNKQPGVRPPCRQGCALAITCSTQPAAGVCLENHPQKTFRSVMHGSCHFWCGFTLRLPASEGELVTGQMPVRGLSF